MARNTKLMAPILVLAVVASAQAQWGFSIGGGGGGFSIGRGGYYGPGYYGPGYYGPGYYGPGYYGPGSYGPGYYGRSGVGVRIGNFGYYEDDGDYYGDRYYYVRPRPRTVYVLPDNAVAPSQSILLPGNKVTSSKPPLKDGDILLRSPPDAAGPVGYGINDQWVYTMKPGQKQALAAGSRWTIEFNRGIEGAEPARYELEPGVYEFVYAEEKGWDLIRVEDGELPLPPEAPPEEGTSEKSAPDGDAKSSSGGDDLLLEPSPK